MWGWGAGSRPWESGGRGGECIYRVLVGLRGCESALRVRLHSCLSGASLGSLTLVFSRFAAP